ncbi:hypothetical protein KKC32_04370 [Patescibacteria group bacterium]|nr:hypothetical protein [Patescibacteria group bacterium]
MVKETMTQKPKPESIWPERRREILNNLRKKVQFAAEFFRAAEKFDPNDPAIKEKVEEIWDKSVKKFPPELVARARIYAEYRQKQEEELAAELEKIFAEDDESDWESEEMNEETERREEQQKEEEKQKEMEALLDPQGIVDFLAFMRRQIGIILKKNNIVRNLPEEPESLIHEIKLLYPRIPKEIKAEDIQRIGRSPFSLNIVMKPSAFERKISANDRRTQGIHYTDTPFNFIKASTPAEEEKTINHENVHNINDGYLGAFIPADRLNHRVSSYQDKRELVGFFEGEERRMLEDSAARQLRFIGRANDYIDILHNEIVAAYEEAEERNFGASAYRLFDFDNRAGAFSTAGSHMQKLIWKIEYLKESDFTDQPLKECLAKLEINLKEKFVSTVRTMEGLSRAASAVGEEVRKEVEILFFFLPPTQYKIIPKYLGEFYDLHEFEEKECVHNLQDFLSLDDLRFGVALLKRRPELLTEELKSAILEKAENLHYELAAECRQAGLTDIYRTREYSMLLKALLSMCGKDTYFIEDICEDIDFAFFFDLLEDDSKKDFTALKSLYSHTTASEQKSLKMALGIYIDDSYILEDLDLDNMDELKKTKEWSVLKSLHLVDSYR